MLKANLLMFSRSLSNDYRWIYADPSVTQADKSLILKDYRAFERNRSYFLSKQHRVVRRLDDAVAVYNFSKTDQTDNCSRPIFALTGLVFSGLEAKIVLALPQIILTLLFYTPDSFNPDLQKVSDNLENSIQPVEFSLDQMIEKYRTDAELYSFADKFNNITGMLSGAPLLITPESISSLKSESNVTPMNSSFSVYNGGILDNKGTRSVIPKHHPELTNPYERQEYSYRDIKSVIKAGVNALFGYFDNPDH